MAINRIDTLQKTTTSLPVSGETQVDRSSRVQLHTDNLFERGSDSAIDPSQFQNQFFNDQQRQGAADRFASLTLEDQNRVTESVGQLRTAVAGVMAGTTSVADAHAALTSAVRTYSSAIQNAPAAASANGAFHSSAGADTASGGMAQVNDIMSYSIHYVENKTAAIAYDLNNKIQAKNNIRTESTELGDMISNWPDDGSTQNFQWNSYTVDDKGNVSVTAHSANLTKDQATQLHEDLSSQLDTMGDITQMQQLDLQQKYQDQQQFMTTLSQILSSSHDTQKNTINNLKVS
jgi:hypothetical protein